MRICVGIERKGMQMTTSRAYKVIDRSGRSYPTLHRTLGAAISAMSSAIAAERLAGRDDMGIHIQPYAFNGSGGWHAVPITDGELDEILYTEAAQ